MSNFELINTEIENWTETEFVEEDPYNRANFCGIELFVDWEKKTAKIDSRYDNGSITMREHNGLASSITLHLDTDATRFKEYYDSDIKPKLEAMMEFFEVRWDGNNYIGEFIFDKENIHKDLYIREIHDNDMLEIIANVPSHNKYMYLSIGDSLMQYRDMIEFFDFDFINADLDDKDVITNIRNTMEDEVVYVMNDDEFVKELKWIQQEYLRDDYDERSSDK